MASKASNTIEDLYKVPDNAKAEIVDGEVILMPPTGGEPGYAGDEIFVSLRDHSRSTKAGRAVGDNKAFLVRLPNRESFSPDAAFYIGPNPGMKFYEGAPVFAVEVRSEGDYGPKAEERIRQKRIDYFQAGTLVVWDLDLKSPDVITSYSSDDPDTPTTYRKGELARAELAVPGWEIPVDRLFDQN
jgi:Uma2 family endonuclease